VTRIKEQLNDNCHSYSIALKILESLPDKYEFFQLILLIYDEMEYLSVQKYRGTPLN
jgi:hypothetical protein